MRNTLSELPVLLFLMRGGFIAGALCFLLRLPRRLYMRSLRGRRAGLVPLLVTGSADILAAFSTASALALTLLQANGGEPRFYAVAGFFAAFAMAFAALDGLVMK